MDIVIKRIYDPADEGDGYRVLVDRLWPRGVSHERARLDEWMKDIAPSPDLRKWFGHEAERFAEFSARYQNELAEDPAKKAAEQELLEKAKKSRVTLLYAAHSPVINHAIVLRDFLLHVKKSALAHH